MLFIDPITKLNLKTGQKNEINKRRSPLPKFIRDEVDISSEAHSVQEIIMLPRQAHELHPEDSLIANLLSAVFYECEKRHTPMTPLDSLLSQQASDITLQTPPIATKSQINQAYSQSADKQTTTEIITKVPVISKTGHSLDFTLYLEVGLGSPNIATLFKNAPNPLSTAAVRTPYDIEYLNQLPHELTFIVDQDGEPDQISKLIDERATKDQETETAKKTESEAKTASGTKTEGGAKAASREKVRRQFKNAEGLRVWLINPQLLTPVILGDKHLGYLYVGNISTQPKRGMTNYDIPLSANIDIEA